VYGIHERKKEAARKETPPGLHILIRKGDRKKLVTTHVVQVWPRRIIYKEVRRETRDSPLSRMRTQDCRSRKERAATGGGSSCSSFADATFAAND